MKILIIGLDGAISEKLFSDERLENIRRLMEYGCYGKLSFEVPTERLGIWMSLVTGQNLESLDEAQSGERLTRQEMAIHKQLENQNKSVIVVGPPPLISYPLEVERRVNDLLPELRLKGEKLTDLDAEMVKSHVYEVSRKQSDLVRSLVQSEEWDYFQFVDDGLYRLHRTGYFESEIFSQDVVNEYYLYLDDQIGSMLELLDDNIIVLVVSLHLTQSFDGGFIIASTNNPLEGQIEGVHLFDLAPTLLELGGYEVPPFMHGNSLVAGKTLETGKVTDLSAEEEEILRERLSGLGYIS